MAIMMMVVVMMLVMTMNEGRCDGGFCHRFCFDWASKHPPSVDLCELVRRLEVAVSKFRARSAAFHVLGGRHPEPSAHENPSSA